jgi:CheY-like chemotaxis protein
MITPTAVLVVDDSLTVRNIVVKSLRNLGFSDVDAAEDGNLALERMRQCNTACSFRIGKCRT